MGAERLLTVADESDLLIKCSKRKITEKQIKHFHAVQVALRQPPSRWGDSDCLAAMAGKLPSLSR